MAPKTGAQNILQPKLHHCKVEKKVTAHMSSSLHLHLNPSAWYLPFFVTALTVLTHVHLVSHWDSPVCISIALSFIPHLLFLQLMISVWNSIALIPIDLHFFAGCFPNLYYALAVSPSLEALANLISTVSFPSSKSLLRTASSTCLGQPAAESSMIKPSVFTRNRWRFQSQYSLQTVLHSS